MKRFKRKRLFVDPSVQGALLLRVALYWFLCLLSVSMLLVCLDIISGKALPLGDDFSLRFVWQDHASVVLALLLILPMLLFDSLRLSNRFAGPFHRIRRALHALAAGEPIEHLQFRPKDYWTDVANDINLLGKNLRSAQEKACCDATGHQGVNGDHREFEATATR